MNPRCLVFCCSRIILRDQSLISWYYQAKNRNYLLLPLFYEHGTKIPRSSKPVSSAISNNSLQNTNKHPLRCNTLFTGQSFVKVLPGDFWPDFSYPEVKTSPNFLAFPCVIILSFCRQKTALSVLVIGL